MKLEIQIYLINKNIYYLNHFKMTHLEIVNKLIGKIKPIGRYEVDREHLYNLVEMRKLTESLIEQIVNIYLDNMDRKDDSVDDFTNYAKDFLFNYLGLKHPVVKNEKWERKSQPIDDSDVVGKP